MVGIGFLFLKIFLYGREAFSPNKRFTSVRTKEVRRERLSSPPSLNLKSPPSFPSVSKAISPVIREGIVPPSLKIPQDMVFVPAGEYIYGWEKDGNPLIVELKGFYIDKYPVTNQKYQEFVKGTGRKSPSDPRGPEYNIWNGKDFPSELADHPVVNVTYQDALSYAKWAGKRLPEEMEWEKASVGKEMENYPWGKEFSPNYCNTTESDIGQTSPVGSFSLGTSPFGCYDMIGNVWEWTSTLYDEKHNWHIAKGGSYKDSGATITIRDNTNPIVQGPTVGFRCLKDAPQELIVKLSNC